jgi:hypothetical protein
MAPYEGETPRIHPTAFVAPACRPARRMRAIDDEEFDRMRGQSALYSELARRHGAIFAWPVAPTRFALRQIYGSANSGDQGADKRHRSEGESHEASRCNRRGIGRRGRLFVSGR